MGSKEVTIKLLAAVAKENNHGTIASAQKAGKAKASPKSHKKRKGKGKGRQVETIAIDDDKASDDNAKEPVLIPKPRGKRKQAESEATSLRKLRKRA
jgi:hypothetical protein